MLYTFFTCFRQIAKSLMLSMSLSSRGHSSAIVAECKEILDSVVKILESMSVKVVVDPEPPVLVGIEVEDLDPEPKVIEDSESEPEVEESEAEEPLIETPVDLPAEPWSYCHFRQL